MIELLTNYKKYKPYISITVSDKNTVLISLDIFSGLNYFTPSNLIASGLLSMILYHIND